MLQAEAMSLEMLQAEGAGLQAELQTQDTRKMQQKQTTLEVLQAPEETRPPAILQAEEMGPQAAPQAEETGPQAGETALQAGETALQAGETALQAGETALQAGLQAEESWAAGAPGRWAEDSWTEESWTEESWPGYPAQSWAGLEA